MYTTTYRYTYVCSHDHIYTLVYILMCLCVYVCSYVTCPLVHMLRVHTVICYSFTCSYVTCRHVHMILACHVHMSPVRHVHMLLAQHVHMSPVRHVYMLRVHTFICYVPTCSCRAPVHMITSLQAHMFIRARVHNYIRNTHNHWSHDHVYT